MFSKRVLLVESGHFIGGVIRSLFQRYDDLSVIEVTPVDSQALIKAVKKHRPQIVVLDDTVQRVYLNDLLDYLRDSSDFRVVVVNTDSNQVEVYQKQQVPVTQSADFFAILSQAG